MSRYLFKYIYDNSGKEYWTMVGDGRRIYPEYKYTLGEKAKKAYELSLEAIEAYKNEYTYTWNSKWREIYGAKF